MRNSNFMIDNGKIKIKIHDEWIIPQIRGYHDIKTIGEPGANGVVLCGIHNITGRKDAIKIWLPRNNSSEVREKQYYEEIKKISKLKNPNIVTIYDAWIEKKCYFCSMEYIEGQTLEAWLDAPRTIDKRLNMLMKIFTTIYFYQCNGVIHGDIHCRNIMIDENEEVHIIDFGTSALSSYETQSKDRENYLMYELVEKVLGTEFSKSALNKRKYSLKGEISYKDDVRTAVPVLFSRTILNYIELLIIQRKMQKLNEPQDLFEVCEKIAKGVYINIDFFYKNMNTWCNEDVINKFPQIFFDTLEDVIYEEAQYNDNVAEEIFCLSLYVYYERYKLFQQEINQCHSDKLKKILKNEDNENLLKVVNDNKTLLEAHETFKLNYIDEETIYQVEIKLRSLLYSILSIYFKEYFLHEFRNEYLRMEEIKLDKKLYKEIICLSYVYRFNNGIDSFEV